MGYKAHNRIDISGKRFGRLTAIRCLYTDSHRKSIWECICLCGNRANVAYGNLVSFTSKSCGCYRNQVRSAVHRKHGMYGTSIYGVWQRMKQRCLNKKTKDYGIYGGRGISIYRPWLNFKNFLMDVGQKPNSKYTLDRINTNGNYEPGNVRWATRKEQCCNRRPFKSRKYKGVYANNKGHWTASIRNNRKSIYLGYFKNQEAAALAYNEKAKELFGAFSHLNKI